MPLLTLDDYLGFVSSQLPETLLSKEHFAGIRSLARQMPAFSMIGFEAELGNDEPAAGFAVGIRTDPDDRTILARWLESAHIAPTVAADRRWQRIAAFVEAWADPASSLFHHVHSIWLEYDNPVQREQFEAPNILFGMSGLESSLEVRQEIVHSALQLLYDNVPPSLDCYVDRCFAALHPREHVSQVGVMLARDLCAVRICISPDEAERIPGCLTRMGWEGEAEPVGDVLRSLAPFYHTVALDFDITDRILPRIGIELYPEKQRRPWLDPVWQGLLDYLTAEGWCIPAKREALLRWPGHGQARLLWTSTILRGLNHLKLTYVSGRPLEAKAYFGLVHTPASTG